jgi:VIT1/CCC1 family predicted Fe2+/Mn2+ transporter
LFTGRKVVFTSLRSLVLGFAAAALTYSVGRVVGVTLI